MREIVAELKTEPQSEAEETNEKGELESCEVVIVPFTGEGDEIVGRILTRLLEVEKIKSEVLSWRALRAEKIEQLRELQAKCILVSAIEARSSMAIGKITRSIKEVLPEAIVLVGLWGLPPQGGARVIRKIEESSAGSVYTSLREAVRGIDSLVSTASEEACSEPVSN
jgi:hypothetical protein